MLANKSIHSAKTCYDLVIESIQLIYTHYAHAVCIEIYVYCIYYMEMHVIHASQLCSFPVLTDYRKRITEEEPPQGN